MPEASTAIALIVLSGRGVLTVNGTENRTRLRAARFTGNTLQKFLRLAVVILLRSKTNRVIVIPSFVKLAQGDVVEVCKQRRRYILGKVF